MELSIIIPTLNEERLLPFLLEKIKKEKLKDCEIIVADASSQDKTVKIAKDYGCKIVQGGLPARGRNNGAKHAKGEILFFLDADILFEEGTLKKSLQEFKRKKIDGASFGIYPQEKNIYLNKTTLNIFYNFPQKIFKNIFPMGAMGILVKKIVFDKIGGFDENIKLAEDHYFIKQVNKYYKFDVIRAGKLFMPLRRFRQDGYFKTFMKYAFCVGYMGIRGPVKKKYVNYNFDHYNNKKIIKKKKKKYVNLQLTRKKNKQEKS